MKKFIADTNIFLRFLLNDIPSQADESERYFKQAAEGKIEILVFPITIFEIVFSFEKFYGKTKKEAAELAKTVVSAPYLKIEDKEVFIEALKKYQDSNVSLVDAFLFYKAEAMNGDVLSFDKDFVRLEKKQS